MDWLKRLAQKKDARSEDHDKDRKIESRPKEEEISDIAPATAEVPAAPYAQEHSVALEDEQTPAADAPDPIDASVEIRISADMMSASVVLRAPKNGGADATVDQVLTTLAEHNVVFGIVKGMLSLKVMGKRYDEPFIAATGVPPQDGHDGEIIELAERKKDITLVEDQHGNVDYKNLNLINEIEQGTVICEIVQPTAPTPGMNIFGTELNGRPGRMPTIPRGENTVLTEDGTKLVAVKSGSLIYGGDKFHVRQILEVPEDVGSSTGNISFSGDVLVKGAVNEGYKITAGGNVTVYGIVEGVYITAGGDINLKQGINGMGKGVIEAKGKINCRYLENCTARAGGSVTAETIVHSNVFSGDSISVVGGRSSIIGGICCALLSIDVKTIGSRMNTMTTIMLGATTDMIDERKTIAAEVVDLEKRLSEISMDVRFIEQRVSSNNLTDKHRQLLQRLQAEYPGVTEKLGKCKKRAEELEEIISNSGNCRLNCSLIYPPTKIIIGNATVVVQDDRNRCTVFYSDGEIKFSYK